MDLNTRLISYLSQHHRLLVSELEAERIIACRDQVVVAQGRDCDSGIPRTLNLESDEVAYAIEEPEGPEDL